jgi:hypothetical protein
MVRPAGVLSGTRSNVPKQSEIMLKALPLVRVVDWAEAPASK